MAFDGGMLHKMVAELNAACDCHIDKIYQPSRDELVFLLRKKGFAKRLLLSAKPGAARIQFTESKYDNPSTPPMFCMLVRKHFSGARLQEIMTNGLERVAIFLFSSTNEMGDRVNIKIVCELIGNQSNIILLYENDRIIDCLRRSDIETGTRLLQPGAKYEFPKPLGKLNPLETKPKALVPIILNNKNMPLSKAVLNTVDGFSPLISREAALDKNGDDPLCENADPAYFEGNLNRIIGDLKNEGVPLLLSSPDGIPSDYTYTDIKQYEGSYEIQKFESYSNLLDAFYLKREQAARIKHSAQDISKLVSNLHARISRRLALRLEDLKKCENREELRIFGELIKANLYAIENGSSFAEVQNYYDDNLGLIRIPLDKSISPAANAAKYFKEYKKTYTAKATLTELIEKDRQELLYIESVSDSLARCASLSDLSEIRDELSLGGYIKAAAGKKGNANKKIEITQLSSMEGYPILIGKNNSQNDYITCRLASKNDLWFHAKNIPGSHVIVMSGGEPVSDETLLKAAGLAAYYSKAQGSAQVPVDYTPVKYVKKPNGAKPGMVIYKTNKTLFVKPEVVNI